MAAWRNNEEEDAARHRQEKREEVNESGKKPIGIVHGGSVVEPAERHYLLLALVGGPKETCTGTRDGPRPA